MKRLPTLLLIILVATHALSQEDRDRMNLTHSATDSLAQFARNILLFNNAFPQEKVYLHFDNTGYFMGETIWFKAYVVNPVTNTPDVISRVLYVELLTPKGRVIETKKLKIEKGQCHGQFSLARLIHPGFYEIRAYTALMLNWQDAPLFSRVFPIFTAPREVGEKMYKNPHMVAKSHTERLPQMRPKKSSADEINLQFFPESGHLVQGLGTNIAFKATDKRGNPIKVSGKIVNQAGELLAELSVQHDGMGRFNLQPIPNENYFAEVSNEKGKKFRFPLPQAESQGCIININNLRTDNLILQVTRSANFPKKLPLALTVMSHGRISLFRHLQWKESDTILIKIPKHELPEGVNHFTLYDTQGNIYAERMAFIPAKNHINITCTTDKQNYRAKEPITMDFAIHDDNGVPVTTTFSLSVRDTETHTPINSSNVGSLAANLLLGSELKGYIHNIDYYLASDDIVHRSALDLLLCTQGWRRYDWKQMSRPDLFEVKYPAEEGIVVTGNLTSTFRKRIKKDVDIQVYIYNEQGHNQRGSCLTDSLGEFAFVAEDFIGRWNMNIITNEKDKAKEMRVNLKKTPSPTSRLLHENETTLYTLQESNISEKTQLTKSEKQDSIPYDENERRHWENLLPTVEVQSDKLWERKDIRSWNNLIYDMEDERMRIDETGEYYLMEITRWLRETNPYFGETTSDNYINAIEEGKDTDSLNPIAYTYKSRPVRFLFNRVGEAILTADEIAINLEELTIGDVEAIAISDKNNLSMQMVDLMSGMSEIGFSSADLLSQWKEPNIVLITLFIRDDYFRYKDARGHRRTKLQGFSPTYEFYMPDYSYADLPDENDYRRTLYWNPVVQSDSTGKARVTFYNSPTCKRMEVDAMTITESGLMGDL